MARTRQRPGPDIAGSPRQVAEMLARPGPHPVLRGNLGLVGLPGVIFTPARGLGLPALAFGHDWLQGPDRYLPLLRHLASWGIVAAAPGSQRGPVPSHARFSGDLRTTLDVLAGVRLGTGEISVDRRRLALGGHGMGGGCAVLTAADLGNAAADRVAAVVTLAVAETRPSAVAAAASVQAPGMHLVAGNDLVTPIAGNAEPLAAAWAGPMVLRTLPKASHLGFLDGRSWVDALLPGSPEASTARLSRALVTAFLLRHLCGDERCDVLVERELKGTVLDEVRS